MTISWYSIRISLGATPNGEVLFDGYFNVKNNVIQNFYYVNNNQYVDILLRELGDFESDNIFINNNFTNNGTNILSVIPYINANYNNPYKLNLYFFNFIGYNNTTNNIDCETIVDRDFSTIFTSISGLPPLSRPFISMGSLFSNNAQVYYKPHSLSSGSGGVGNYRIKQRKT